MKIVLALLLSGFLGQARAEVRVTDDAGHTVTLSRPARRVISLAPGVTEILFEAGGGDRLVGAVEFSDFPPEALKVPRIGNNQKLDLERIVALKPDLILVWFHGNATREVDALASLGIPMAHLDPLRIEDIPDAIERIGVLIGAEKTAHEAAQRFRARHAALRARYADRPAVRVFYQIADKPLLTINDHQIISDVLVLCGGRNVFGKERQLVPQLSTESVVAANPDVIVTAKLGAPNGGDQTPVRAPGDSRLALWARFSEMTAVKRAQLWLIPGDAISRSGPRILDGAQAICTVLDEARK
jgi:iron complex transport system substrate-binding protein